MSRKLFVLFASAAATALSASVATANDTFPLSVNESGPVYPQHQAAPANVGSTSQTSASGVVVSPRAAATQYEVRTPSSVSESAPWRVENSGR